MSFGQFRSLQVRLAVRLAVLYVAAAAIAVGRDCRLHSPRLFAALADGLRAGGFDVRHESFFDTVALGVPVTMTSPGTSVAKVEM